MLVKVDLGNSQFYVNAFYIKKIYLPKFLPGSKEWRVRVCFGTSDSDFEEWDFQTKEACDSAINTLLDSINMIFSPPRRVVNYGN